MDLTLGKSTVILGPNGSGKSTFLKLITREVYPVVKRDSFIKLFGEELINLWDLRSKIGFVSSDLILRTRGNLSCYEIIASGFFGSLAISEKQFINSKQKQSTPMKDKEALNRH